MSGYTLDTPDKVRDALEGPWFGREGETWCHLSDGVWADRKGKTGPGGPPPAPPLDAAHMRVLHVSKLGLKRTRPGLLARIAGRIRNTWFFEYSVYLTYIGHYVELGVEREPLPYRRFMWRLLKSQARRTTRRIAATVHRALHIGAKPEGETPS